MYFIVYFLSLFATFVKACGLDASLGAATLLKKRSGYEIRQKCPRIGISGTQEECALVAKSPNFWTFTVGLDHIFVKAEIDVKGGGK